MERCAWAEVGAVRGGAGFGPYPAVSRARWWELLAGTKVRTSQGVCDVFKKPLEPQAHGTCSQEPGTRCA